MSDNAAAGFSAALQVWKDINLHELQKTLDGQGLEIVENQKDSLVGRKKLAEQTREFKKVSDEDKGAAFKTLLKAYQGEIDSLTKRSKAAENSFLSVYKLLAEAPDPFPLLDAAVDQTARASEARLLESELARERDEVALLKQQLADAQAVEKERKKLQDKVDKFESRMDEMILDKVGAKEAELHATYDERLRNYDEREKDLQRQVTVARSQLRELRTTNDSSQAKLFDHSQRQDAEMMARLAEADLVTQDLERANSRVAEVERRNEKLRAEIESVRSGSESAERVAVLESQISDLQTEATRLIRSLDTQKDQTDAQVRAASRKADELTREVEAKTKEVAGLKDRMKQFADYDELKRELEIMKYVEFAGMDLDEQLDDDDDPDAVRMPNPNADKANQQRGNPLENLLMSKNKKLQEELTNLRVAHEEVVASHRSINTDLDALHSRFEEQRSLNDRLENDLLRINQSGGGGGGGGSGTVTPSTREDPLATLNLGRKEPTPSAAPSSAETSILPIITSQRDRFRTRNAELEEELRRQFETISELRGEIKTLQADNLKLYEKVRYLQSYRDEGAKNPNNRGFNTVVRGDEELGKYHSKYEESMNPFERFKGNERNRGVASLNPIEKILLSLSSVVLRGRFTRNLFVVYAFGLHFLLLSALYRHSAGTEGAVSAVPPPPVAL